MSPARRPQATLAPYPPISDYAFIGDCHSAALVSRDASIDWCCMPRFDSGSVFGRILDWERGGYCLIVPEATSYDRTRRYVDDTMVLETTFRTGGGEARLYDCFTMRRGGAWEPYQQILRVVEGVRGRMDLHVEICPRVDYGEVRPWIRQQGVNYYSAIGGNDGLLIASDGTIQPGGQHDLEGRFTVRGGERVHLSIEARAPELIADSPPDAPTPHQMDRRLDETLKWWRRWGGKLSLPGPDAPAAIRSALVLKALTNAPTGSIAAAPTTSLPEAPGGSRNWDYRFTWIRDSSFAVRSLAELGAESEADGFRRFVERSAAGNAGDLQILYGVGGERRVTEILLEHLSGYRESRPVRTGNAAASQIQLDVYGELLDLAYRWHNRGHSPDDDYWRFIVELVNATAERWVQPDCGLWEIRGPKKHFVHSKAMCWVAMDRGIRLAHESGRRAPLQRWRKVRNEIRRAIERQGYDRRRGVFVRAFGSRSLDAALLLLPAGGFVAWDDERMVRTADAIRDELGEDGLLRRYRGADGLKGAEGAFLACSFWLAECYARQGRHDDARDVFDRTVSTGNDLGLFSEEFDAKRGEMLGNFPLGLTHLSHVAAAVALARSNR
jgi:GH15 family glucan-1,4-alpha-glucosidase